MKRAVALGTFDGVHSGHRAVLKHSSDYLLTVITFGFPPKSYFSGNTELLMTVDDRKKALYELGAEKVVILDFEKVKDTDADIFLNSIKADYSPDLILCGFNYKFGKNATGNTELIRKFCIENGIELSVCPAIENNGLPLSSTYIRNLITAGDIESANRYIYGGFGFTSTVLHGDKRGRKIGFPTINQSFPEELIKPKFGVYASRIIIDGKSYNCVTNIGVRPTFKTEKVTCESFIFDFSDDIYGKSVTLKPLRFLREEKKFDGLTTLKKAIDNDLAVAEKYFYKER